MSIAKNYLNEDELAALNNLMEQYLVFAECQAVRRIAMHMQDWVKKLDGFLMLNDRNVLDHADKFSHEFALNHAIGEYEEFYQKRLQMEVEQADDRNFKTLAKQIIDQNIKKLSYE